jgi:hypothetical protein
VSFLAVRAAHAFSTTFPDTENPLSQGSIWTHGGATGLEWQNIRATGGSPGTCYGVGAATESGVEDCIAAIQGRFNTQRHFAQFTVHKPGGYTPPSSHEIELHVGCTIGANSIFTYEMLFPYDGSFLSVRWNGTYASFTYQFTGLDTVSGDPANLASLVDGDVVRAEFDSTSGSPVITLKRNGSTSLVITDTAAGKITSGSPGLAFFARSGTGLDMTKYGVRAFSAGSL